MTMLQLENINTFYDNSHILHDVSLEVEKGEIVVLLGRNGVGKTTTLKSIMGIEPPKTGKIVFKGKEITGMQPHQIARLGIALVPEDRRILPNLTVFENLKMGMLVRKKSINMNERLELVFDYFPILKERLNQKGESLSGGEQQMLTIARAHVSEPELMLIDEPTEGVAPILVEEISEILKRLQRDGVTILLVEQNYQLSLNLSDNERAYVIEKGQIRMCGTPGELQACQLEVEKFLGVKI
ncbi:MAG: ABC transporter ATP-binding protein [Deltaproteobacteria bacterium]|jgi:branched-chain amino acid transport system ATP-binding protein|nr:ABC transporter ATP-binding protein [Deltaproteobacteria bacterium]